MKNLLLLLLVSFSMVSCSCFRDAPKALTMHSIDNAVVLDSGAPTFEGIHRAKIVWALIDNPACSYKYEYNGLVQVYDNKVVGMYFKDHKGFERILYDSYVFGHGANFISENYINGVGECKVVIEKKDNNPDYYFINIE